MDDIRDILNSNPIVPVVILDRVEDTAPLCEALLQGGIQAIEITLRTEAAMAAIGEAARRFPDMTVGAGTLLNADQVKQVMDLGAKFGVSPGSTPALLDAVSTNEFPFLPGGSTMSEFMALAEASFVVQKFFPASPAGGPAFLRSVASPLADISFCPTGGINAWTMQPTICRFPMSSRWVVHGLLVLIASETAAGPKSQTTRRT